jgi:hypothetical protein
MRVGLLWYDPDPKRCLAEKIERAAAYYQKKLGQAPNACFVHPSVVAEQGQLCGAVMVKPDRIVLPNHFWIGVSKAGRESCAKT